MIERETEVDQLYFLYVGVAHIYGYMEIEGELLRYKIVTLKKGSWYGDFQILLDISPDYELEAGGENEYNIKHVPKGMFKDQIMVYTLDKDLFLETVNKYPQFRSFLVTRGVLRRQYFRKIQLDNE